MIKTIAESKHKKKGTKTDNKVVHVERENNAEIEVDKGRKQTSDEMLLPKRFY